MPWQQTDPVNERLKFVVAAQGGPLSMTELCRKFGISRKTGYKLLARYERDGPEGMRDRSRAAAGGTTRRKEADDRCGVHPRITRVDGVRLT